MPSDLCARVIFLLMTASSVCWCLRITEVFLPKSLVRGGEVTLQCQYDSEGSQVYVVKWYKDGQEFYHYQPSSKQPQGTYPVAGFRVKLDQSSLTSVTLTEIEFQAAGAYKCEVSAEAPRFWTVFREQNMTIVALPSSSPQIRAPRPFYRPGETTDVSCTSQTRLPIGEEDSVLRHCVMSLQPQTCSRSPTQTAIKWFLNGEQVSADFVSEDYFVDANVPLSGDYVITSRSRLQLPVRRHHFTRDVMELTCVASVDSVYWDSVLRRFYSEDSLTAETLRKSNDANAMGSTHGKSAIQALALLVLLYHQRHLDELIRVD